MTRCSGPIAQRCGSPCSRLVRARWSRKTPTTDGYDAVRLGLVEFVKPQRINKPATGHLEKAGAEGSEFLREFPLAPGDEDFKLGDKVLVDQFEPRTRWT